MCAQTNKIGGNFIAKKFPPIRLQETLMFVAYPLPSTGEVDKPHQREALPKRSGERSFFKQVLPGLLL
jgi:hypothetical protein